MNIGCNVEDGKGKSKRVKVKEKEKERNNRGGRCLMGETLWRIRTSDMLMADPCENSVIVVVGRFHATTFRDGRRVVEVVIRRRRR